MLQQGRPTLPYKDATRKIIVGDNIKEESNKNRTREQKKATMANFSSGFPLISGILFMIVLIILTSAFVDASDGATHQLSWISMGTTCRGSIAECMSGKEFEMDSESNRRILATTKYISYESLKRNNVPCSRRGASYYNCRPGAEANPYTRGCSAITHCRS